MEIDEHGSGPEVHLMSGCRRAAQGWKAVDERAKAAKIILLSSL